MNLCNYLYGTASAFTRLEMFKWVILSKYNPKLDLDLYRFDTDSVIFAFRQGYSDSQWIILNEWLDKSSYKYKLENRILYLKSFSQQSHFYKTIENIDGLNVIVTKLKTCGLSLSLHTRNLIHNCIISPDSLHQ